MDDLGGSDIEQGSRRRTASPRHAAAFRRDLSPDATARIAKRHLDGTHRVEAPERTVARLLPRLAGFGITRVARITGFDRTGVEVFTVARPNARALSVANGKGLTRAAAKASGIMEAIEQWHAERPVLPLRFGDLTDLAGTGATVHRDLPRLHPIPDLPGLWAPALDLGTGDAALVPFDAVHTCWLASTPDSPYYTSTNGLASGSHVVEATVHGLCEVIERDACALFDALPAEARTARQLAPATIDALEIARLLDQLATRGFDVALWDATTDIGAPVILAALTDARDLRGAAGFGAGCHTDRSVAALRALTEAAQTRAIALTGTRDDLFADLYAPTIAARFRWAMGGGAAATPRRWTDVPTRPSDDLRDDLRALLAGLDAAGIGPALAVDLSREPGLAVVRILVPGLEAGGPGDGVLPGRRNVRAGEILA